MPKKDYPPAQTFEDAHPDHYQAFQDGLPFSSHTGASGMYNMAAHHPVEKTTKPATKIRMAANTKPDIGALIPARLLIQTIDTV